MTALVLIAVDRHLDGHPRQAFVVAFFAALDRPEIWVFWGPYGLWLMWKDPGARKLVMGLFVLIPVLWFLPEYWGSGHFFRGVSRANHPRSNSPAFVSCPFCKELSNASVTVLSRIKIAKGSGGRRRPRVLLVRAAARAGAICKLSGVRERAWADRRRGRGSRAGVVGADRGPDAGRVLGQQSLPRARRGADRGRRRGGCSGGRRSSSGKLRRRALTRAAGQEAADRFPLLSGSGPAVVLMAAVFAVIPGFVGNSMTDIQRTHRALVYQAKLRTDLSAIISDDGGAKRVLACGSVMTEGFQVPMVAYALGVHTLEGASAAGCAAPDPPDAAAARTRSCRPARSRTRTLLPAAANDPRLGARGTTLPDLPARAHVQAACQPARLR